MGWVLMKVPCTWACMPTQNNTYPNMGVLYNTHSTPADTVNLNIRALSWIPHDISPPRHRLTDLHNTS